MTTNIIAFPTTQCAPVAQTLLDMLLEQAHLESGQEPDTGLLSIELAGWQIDLLSCYGAQSEDFEDEGDGEEEDVV